MAEFPDVIIPNLNRRFSGITATVAAVLPQHQQECNVATVGYALPVDVPSVGWIQLIRGSQRKARNGVPVIFHARRNIEMLAGLVLKYLFRCHLHLVFTSTAQRRHSRWTRFLYWRMDTLLSTSPRAASWLERKPSAIIPHGVNTSVYQPPADRRQAWMEGGLPGQFGIGIFGRVRPQKGLREFVTALCQVLPQVPGATAVIIGETTPAFQSFHQELQGYIHQHCLSDRFCWLGKLPFAEIPKWFQRMSIVACVPHNEGFGLTCLEAMASGVAVVATKTGAFESIVREGVDGCIVDCADASALQKALLSMLSDLPKLEQKGLHARQRILSDFTLETEAGRIHEVYREVLKK